MSGSTLYCLGEAWLELESPASLSSAEAFRPLVGGSAAALALALPLLRGKGVCTAVITCDRNNLASASTILRCKGIEAGEILDPDTGGINRIFKICLSDG